MLIDVVCLFSFFFSFLLPSNRSGERCYFDIAVQGTGDNFYKQGQLLPENFEKAAKEAGVVGVNVRYQPDYDHSYYTMATFSDDHVEHAAKYLFA